MTERTYGMADYTLEELESSDAYEEFSSSTVKALATHIHELQTELAELKLQHITSVSQAIELQAVASALYQIFGVYDAPENVLDLVLAAAQGEALPCDPLDLLPFSLDEEKLKAERREFGMRVAEAVRKEVQAPNYGSYTSLQSIVEQELNK